MSRFSSSSSQRGFGSRFSLAPLPILISVAMVGVVFFALFFAPVAMVIEQTLIEVGGQIASKTQGFFGSIHHTWSDFLYRGYTQKMQELENENIKLQEKIFQLKYLESENKAFKASLNVASDLKHRFLTASLLTSPLRGWNRFFLIAAGKKHGIQRGQPVTCAQGIVGRIDRVGYTVSRVMPLTHTQCRIPVVGLSSHINGVVEGTGVKSLKFAHLKESTSSHIKEIFVTSRYGGAFPPGLIVGQFNDRKLDTFVPWGKLQHVQVILDYPLSLPLNDKGSE